ncbi:hypothetical protein [Antarcticirhabdus aurantiaca]|uniref:Uncharacterized protein n=1 Tax=Antarcticirhabdus aurantiaca TaxID=2606717 RepID=A0ACD4NR32_9HYPH|nr:hypothetical protein OXU80_03455 [Jeongeuplla avenae]
MTAAWMPMLDGRTLVFSEPVFEPAHLFGEIAHGLALTNRFSGQTMLPYSVAQHSLLAAEGALKETGDTELAALCLLHDGHEAPFGDWTRPAMDAVEEEIRRAAIENGATEIQAKSLAVRMRSSVERVKARLDRAILTAAGLDPGGLVRRAAEVREYDMRALFTEKRDLLSPQKRTWGAFSKGEPKPLPTRRGGLRSMHWSDAQHAWCTMLANLCPDAAQRAGWTPSTT